ncbi:amidase family protein [Mycobacterium tuberculosis]
MGGRPRAAAAWPPRRDCASARSGRTPGVDSPDEHAASPGSNRRGRAGRHGVVELAASYDHVGPITRSHDAAVLLSVIAGSDIHDPRARRSPFRTMPPTSPRHGFRVSGWTGRRRRRLTRTPRRCWPMSSKRSTTSDGPSSTSSCPRLRRWWQRGKCARSKRRSRMPTPTRRAPTSTADHARNDRRRTQLAAVEYQTLTERRLEFTRSLRRVFHDVDILLMPSAGSRPHWKPCGSDKTRS